MSLVHDFVDERGTKATLIATAFVENENLSDGDECARAVIDRDEFGYQPFHGVNNRVLELRAEIAHSI